jgi:hypothetical protein
MKSISFLIRSSIGRRDAKKTGRHKAGLPKEAGKWSRGNS